MTNTPQHGQGPEYGQDGSRYGTAAYSPQQSFDRPEPEKVDTLRKVAVLSLIIAVIDTQARKVTARIVIMESHC